MRASRSAGEWAAAMQVEDQREVISFLADPASYAPPARVERIDTHSAVVFLAGDRAYKLKRAVRYDYLDFSTRELRRAACERETLLNRRTAPGVYLSVVAITREADGHLAFGGIGPPVDHVVHMVRFDQDLLFDRLASRGALSEALMPPLADAVAAAHAAAPTRPERGGLADMAWVVDGNADGFREFPDVLDPDLCADLTIRSRAALARLAGLLEARRVGGRVRECHGDLHLRNIVLLDGRPTLFDAVEFNDRISCIDVVYDAAFLVMDLWRLNMRVHANAFFNRYLEAADELAALPLLPLFLACRSAVRAKTSATAARLQTDPAAAAALGATARSYLSAARALIDPPAPRLVAVGGLAGTGKSTLARALAPDLGAVPGAVLLRSDVIRKSLFGVAPTVRLGAEAYAAEVSQRVYAELSVRTRQVLAAGHSAIVDAVFGDPAERRAIAAVAASAGVPFAGLWLDAPYDVSAARILRRRDDASDATVAVLDQQRARPVGAIDWIRLDASGDRDRVARRAGDALQHAGARVGSAEVTESTD